MSYKEQFIWQKAGARAEGRGQRAEVQCLFAIASSIKQFYSDCFLLPSAFILLPSIALGSARELDTQLTIALRVELAKTHFIKSVLDDVDEIQRLLVSATNKLKGR